MSEPRQVLDLGGGWGPAERAAVDRCLSLPSMSLEARPPPRLSLLARTIEAEIIPRLMLAHQDESAPALAGPLPVSAEVRELAARSIGRAETAALDYVTRLIEEGWRVEPLLLHVLAPTARLLGEMWREDLASFAEVTIGLSRLQHILRVASALPDLDRQVETGGRAFLAPAPDEQHGFGVSVLESFFTRAGWEVEGGCGATVPDLLEAVEGEWFDVVGLSLSCDVLLDRLPPAIRAARRLSRNPSLFVMVGGRFFVDHPEKVADVGADVFAPDAREAVRVADARLSFTLARC